MIELLYMINGILISSELMMNGLTN
jgi:hypothetical protein